MKHDDQLRKTCHAKANAKDQSPDTQRRLTSVKCASKRGNCRLYEWVTMSTSGSLPIFEDQKENG